MIWGNDFQSQTLYKGGIAVTFTDGEMQGWIVAYDRFIHDVGFAVNAGELPHDVLSLRNAFAAKQPESSAVTGDVSYLRLVENTFAGLTSKALPDGTTTAQNRGNGIEAVFTTGNHPTAPVPSLSAWQKQQKQQQKKKLPAQAVLKGTKL
jgi:hypothetical protein